MTHSLGFVCTSDQVFKTDRFYVLLNRNLVWGLFVTLEGFLLLMERSKLNHRIFATYAHWYLQLLLGYLPPDRGLWSSELVKKRSQYKQFKEEILMNPVRQLHYAFILLFHFGGWKVGLNDPLIVSGWTKGRGI